jgi:two-component system sensor histidine kinase YesM
LLFFLPTTIAAVTLTAVASYAAAVQVVSDRSRVLMGETVRQSAALLDSSLRSLLGQLVGLRYDRAFLDALEAEVTPVPDTERYEQIMALNARFQDVASTSSAAIDSIYAQLGSGRVFSLIPEATPLAITNELRPWLNLPVGPGGLGWMGPHEDKIFRTSDPRTVVTMALRVGHVDSKLRAVLLFNLRVEFFQNLFRGMSIGDHGYLVFIDEVGQPWYLSDVATNLRLADGAGRLLADGTPSTVAARGGGTLVAARTPLALGNWTLAAVVPESDLSGPMNRIAWISLVILAVLITATSVVALVFSKTLTSSLTYLSRQSARFVAGDLEVPFSTGDTNEIGDLSRDLATMAGSVRSLLAQSRDDQEKKRALELAVLQTQIQPHFVANTLASARHLVQLGDAPRADQMLSALGRYFHNGLAGGQALVPLVREWDHTHDYLTIQKLRYADDFDFSMDPVPADFELAVPKIIVQPLVENALYHGLKDSGRYGTIAVGLTVTDTWVEVAVEDDGVGIPPGRLVELQVALDSGETGGPFLGLRNVHQRLRLQFGPGAGLVIGPAEPRGTLAVLRLPRRGAR